MSAAYGTVEWFEGQFADADGPDGDGWGHRWRGSQKLRHRRYLAMLAPVLSARPERILDIGCAVGDFTARLAEPHSGHRITGIDISPYAVAAAARRAAGMPAQALAGHCPVGRGAWAARRPPLRP